MRIKLSQFLRTDADIANHICMFFIPLKMTGKPVETFSWEYFEYNKSQILNCIFDYFTYFASDGSTDVWCNILKKYKRALFFLNPLTLNDLYISRSVQLTSKYCILYICSENVGAENFKLALHAKFFLFKMQFGS
jgi:hypothetical protein